MPVTDISPGNKALEFIDARIQDDEYRGSVSSQHNRYTMGQFVDILTIFEKHSPNGQAMAIRTTDIAKRPENLPEEKTYSIFCNEAKEKVGIGTQDAMRKNLFVDMHRMGLINRLDMNRNKLDPFSRGRVKYVSIAPLGYKLIKTGNSVTDRFFIFSKGLDSLLGGFINILLNIFRDELFEIKKINIYEYMFFISAINTNASFTKSIDEAVELVHSYRNLSNIQRKSSIEFLKKELQPSNYPGSKKNKRDFHNWKNKSDQIYKLLNQAVYFDKIGEDLVWSSNQEFDTRVENKKLNRSLSEKHLYFKEHNVEKTRGFELHHVVPLSWSESMHHFKMLDKWLNLVYIDAFSHARITQNKNKNVSLEFNGYDVRLSDYSNDEVYLKNKDNILYDINKSTKIKEYNTELLQTV